MITSTKNSAQTIAIAAAVLFLCGTFAAAGDYTDVSRNDGSGAVGKSASLVPGDLANFFANASGVIGIDQNDNGARGGGNRFRYLVKPWPEDPDDPEDDKTPGRFIDTICLLNPVGSQMVCIGG